MKILFFSGDWCSNCPSVKRLIKTMKLDTVDFDADKDPNEFKHYAIRGIPTLLFIDNDGKETQRLTGKITQDMIESFLGGNNAE